MPSGSRLARFRLPLFRKDQRGVVAIITALCLTALIGMAAMALDLGLAYSRRSALQGATDMAALSATYALPTADASVANALIGNGFSTNVTHTTVTGNYSGTAATAQAARFVANGTPVNAVQVSTQATSPLLFGRIFTSGSTLALGTTATATRIDLAGLMAGTTLVSADTNQIPVVNAVLGGLLGTSLNLTAISYQSLAQASVSAAALLPALAVQANLTTGTYGQLANVSLTAGQIITAAYSAAVTTSGATSSAAVALAQLSGISATTLIPLSTLIGLSAYANEQIGALSSSALASSVNLYSLVTAAAELSAGTSTISLTPNVNLAGITGVTVLLNIGQAAQNTPFLTFSPVGSSVRTAQIRLYITFNLASVNLLGLVGVKIVLPVYVEAASGTATMAAITCGSNPATDATVKVAAQTGLANVWIGSVKAADFANSAAAVTPTAATITSLSLLGIGLLNVTALSGPDTLANGSAALTFSQAQIQAVPPAAQTVTSNAGDISLSLSTGLTLGGGVSPTQKISLLSALNPVFNAIDPLVTLLAGTLGIKLGAMDVTVTGVRCGVPVLVQ